VNIAAMYSRYLKYVAYVVGALPIAAAIAALGFVCLRPLHLPQYQIEKAPEHGYRPGGANCEPAQLDRLTGGNAANERARCAEAAEDHRLKQNDLVEETRSADANVALSVLTYRQTVILLLGSILGLLTLGAAIYAAWYAKRAAEAAEENLEHARHTARPYISSQFDKFRFDESSATARFETKFKNTGNTPANQLLGNVVAIFKYKNGGRVPLFRSPWNNGTTAPGSEFGFDQELTLAPDELRALKEGKGSIMIEIDARYLNACGEEWVFEHRYSADDRCIKSGNLWTEGSQQYRATSGKSKEAHEPNLPLGKRPARITRPNPPSGA
jgi:hypothetical protein